MKKTVIILIANILILSIFFGNFSSASGQYEVEWKKSYGGEYEDWGNFVKQTNDGGFIIIGTYAKSSSPNSYDVWLIKTDSSGNEQWNKTFGGELEDRGISGYQTVDRGFIVMAATNSYGAGNFDIWLIKTDSSGNEVWNKTIGSVNRDYGLYMDKTSDNGYVITGLTGIVDTTFQLDTFQVLLIKIDSDGNKIWNKTYGGSSYEQAYAVKQTSDGGFIIAGITDSYGSGWHDVILIKTNSEGVEEWNTTFGGDNDHDYGYSVAQSSDGGYIISGSTDSYSETGWGDVWLIKTDSNGYEEWNKTYSSELINRGYHVFKDNDNGYVIVGSTGPSDGSNDLWILKVDSNGNKEWDKIIGENGDDRGNMGDLINNGDYIITGFGKQSSANRGDVWLIKMSEKSISGNDSKDSGETPGFELIFIIFASLSVLFLKRKRIR